jgi:hypothetical protein
MCCFARCLRTWAPDTTNCKQTSLSNENASSAWDARPATVRQSVMSASSLRGGYFLPYGDISAAEIQVSKFIK